MKKIITSRDYADMQAEAGYIAEQKALKAKIARWNARVAADPSNIIARDTRDRLVAELEAL